MAIKGTRDYQRKQYLNTKEKSGINQRELEKGKKTLKNRRREIMRITNVDIGSPERCKGRILFSQVWFSTNDPEVLSIGPFSGMWADTGFQLLHNSLHHLLGILARETSPEEAEENITTILDQLSEQYDRITEIQVKIVREIPLETLGTITYPDAQVRIIGERKSTILTAGGRLDKGIFQPFLPRPFLVRASSHLYRLHEFDEIWEQQKRVSA